MRREGWPSAIGQLGPQKGAVTMMTDDNSAAIVKINASFVKRFKRKGSKNRGMCGQI